MLVSLISALFFILHLKTTMAITVPDTDVILGKGLKHYQQSQYIEAQNAFQSLLKSYPDSSSLLFNLGLIHYQLGRYGFAIGLWHKALDQNPYFIKATQAIEFAQKHIPTQTPLSPWQERIKKWVLNYISWDICLFLTAVIGFFFLWLKIKYLAIYNLALKKGHNRPAIPTNLIILGLLFALTVTITFIKTKDLMTLRAIIISPKVSAYVSPNQETASLFELSEGSDVIIKQTNNNWVQVSYLRGQTGWVQQKDVFHYAGEKLW